MSDNDSAVSPSERSSRGIQELLDLIREKGVAEGQAHGTRIVEDAEQRAEWLVKQAREEADKIVKDAREEAEFIREAGEEALQMAFRDIQLKLKDQLAGQFAQQLSRLIQKELSEPDTLRLLLLHAAGKAGIPNEKLTIELPNEALALDDLRAAPEQLQKPELLGLMSQVAREVFTEGFEIRHGKQSAGLRFVLKDGKVTVDLSDPALTRLLLAHLQPRFRAVLEGVVA